MENPNEKVNVGKVIKDSLSIFNLGFVKITTSVVFILGIINAFVLGIVLALGGSPLWMCILVPFASFVVTCVFCSFLVLGVLFVQRNSNGGVNE